MWMLALVLLVPALAMAHGAVAYHLGLSPERENMSGEEVKALHGESSGEELFAFQGTANDF